MFELQLHCPEDKVEALEDALDAAGALSVSIEDADAGTDAERGLFGEPGMEPATQAWQHSRVSALFADEHAAAAAGHAVAGIVDRGVELLAVRAVPQQDWVRVTQAQFGPVEIADGFWIVPTWHEPPAVADHVIRLDPGLAFGTGTHPTTRMCLRYIADRAGQFRRVLDYGCGSGILAIAAARFGATDVDAVDIDPAAVESARVNAAVNGVSLRAGLPDMTNNRYDLVLANILASPLKVLAPLLCSKVAPGGTLVLAGILQRQAQELTQTYAPYCELSATDHCDGWILMTACV